MFYNLYGFFLNIEFQNIMHLEHFEICILKLIKKLIYRKLVNECGRRVIAISGSLILSKTLMELTFNPCGEFR